MIRSAAALFLAATWLCPFALSAAPEQTSSAPVLDVILRGGTVIDGTGAPPVREDVGIREGRIVALGDLSSAAASRTIDASRLYVTPGFIDMHSHAEVGLSDPYLATATNNLLQGITTVVVGQDGSHAWELGGSFPERVALWRRQGVGNNVIPLVGQGAARLEAMGFGTEPATPEQRAAIQARVEELLRAGAWGLSSGLGYVPGKYSPPEEVIDAARPLAKYGGFYISHLRDQADGLLGSVNETIRLARETGATVVITHIKAAFRRNWGQAEKVIDLIEAAREEGLAVYGDLYPYDTSIDGLNFSLVPTQAIFSPDELETLAAPTGADPAEILRWAYRLDPSLAARVDPDFLLERSERRAAGAVGAGGAELIGSQPVYRRRIRDLMATAESRTTLLAMVEKRLAAPGGADLFRIMFHPDDALIGRSVVEEAKNRGLTEAQAAVELTLEGAKFLVVQMSELDIMAFIEKPYIAGGTDGNLPEFGDPGAHPRSYGTFPRRIRRYVYDLGLIELPFAVRTATGLAAEIIGLSDRGLIEKGRWADVIAFDPGRVRDRATYRDPHRFSEGVEWVLVNGEVVVEEGRVNAHRAGRVLLRSESGEGDSAR